VKYEKPDIESKVDVKGLMAWPPHGGSSGGYR